MRFNHRYFMMTMSIGATLGASAWYWASASDRDASEHAQRDASPQRRAAVEAHPDVIAWKAASGVDLVDAAFHHYAPGPRPAGNKTTGYASYDIATLEKLADGGDPKAAFIHAMNPRRTPDEAIRYLEAAAVGGGYSAALFQIALQCERKAIAQGARPLMLRLREHADTPPSPLDEDYLSWLRAAAMLNDVLAESLLHRGLSSLPPARSAAIEPQAQRHLDELNRKRAEHHLAPLHGAPATAAVREYVARRFPPRTP